MTENTADFCKNRKNHARSWHRHSIKSQACRAI